MSDIRLLGRATWSSNVKFMTLILQLIFHTFVASAWYTSDLILQHYLGILNCHFTGIHVCKDTFINTPGSREATEIKYLAQGHRHNVKMVGTYRTQTQDPKINDRAIIYYLKSLFPKCITKPFSQIFY